MALKGNSVFYAIIFQKFSCEADAKYFEIPKTHKH